MKTIDHAGDADGEAELHDLLPGEVIPKAGEEAVVDRFHARGSPGVFDDLSRRIVGHTGGQGLVREARELFVTESHAPTERDVGRHSIVAIVDNGSCEVRKLAVLRLEGIQVVGGVKEASASRSSGWFATARNTL